MRVVLVVVRLQVVEGEGFNVDGSHRLQGCNKAGSPVWEE